ASRGVGAGVAQPWCVVKPEYHEPKFQAHAAELIAQTSIEGQPLPICPDEAYPPEVPEVKRQYYSMTVDEMNRWADRGAINAGIQVFLYVQALSDPERRLKPKPAYDRCELLTAAP